MHSLTALVDVPQAVVEVLVTAHMKEYENVQRFDIIEGVTLLATGEPGVVLNHWRSDSSLTAAFGSDIRYLSPATLGNLLHAVHASRRLNDQFADLVLLSISDEYGLTAISGNGAHRFFKRRLPSGGTVLSTQIKTVAIAESPAAVDRAYEDFFLGFGFHPDNKTMFVGVDQLSALSVWNPDTGIEERLTLESGFREVQFDTGSELMDLLFAATDRQSRGIDHCAVFLGGFDSALVCALLKELGKKVTGFTFDFGDDKYNQTNIDVVTDWLDIDHRWVPINESRILSGFNRLPSLLNAPGAQPHYQLHTVFAAEDVNHAGFQLALTGDGCDTIFLGYPSIYRRSTLMTRLKRMPVPVSWPMLGVLSMDSVDRLLGHVARTGRSALRAAALPYPAAGHLPTQYFDGVGLARLRVGESPPQHETLDEIRTRLAVGLDSLPPATLAFLGYSLTGSSRIKVDGSVMHTGVAQATPFKDPAVVRFANELPESSLRPEGDANRGLGKQYLIDRVIESGLLPAQVALQRKQSPSTSPIDNWYMGSLRDEILNQLEHLPFDWNRDYVENLLRPKGAEEWYRNRIALSPHALQVVGLLWSYAAFARLSG